MDVSRGAVFGLVSKLEGAAARGIVALLRASGSVPLHLKKPKIKPGCSDRGSYVALEALHQVHCSQLQGLFNDFSKQATDMLEAQAKDRKFLVEVTELNLRSNVKSLYTICKEMRGKPEEKKSNGESVVPKKRSRSKSQTKDALVRAKRKLRLEVSDAYYGLVSRRQPVPPADRLQDEELVQLVLSNLPLFKRKRQKCSKSSGTVPEKEVRQ